MRTFTAPGTYDPKHVDTSFKASLTPRRDDFKPDQNPGKNKKNKRRKRDVGLQFLRITGPGTYDPKHLNTSRKVTIRQRLNDFKPDQTPGKNIENEIKTVVNMSKEVKHYFSYDSTRHV